MFLINIRIFSNPHHVCFILFLASFFLICPRRNAKLHCFLLHSTLKNYSNQTILYRKRGRVTKLTMEDNTQRSWWIFSIKHPTSRSSIPSNSRYMRINSAIAHPISGLSVSPHSKHKKERKLSINKDSRNSDSNQSLPNSIPHGCKQ